MTTVAQSDLRAVALVSEVAAQRLREALPNRRIEVVHSSTALRRSVDGGIHCSLVDPGILNDEAFRSVLGSVQAAGVPLILWCELTPENARRVVQSAAMVPTEVVFRGLESRDAVLDALMRHLPFGSASSFLLRALAPPLGKLPLPLTAASVALFGWAAIPTNVADFASGCRCSRRTVERDLRRAGLTGARRFLGIARVARARCWLVESRRSVAGVAEMVGYSSVRTFNANHHAFLGMSPRQGVRRLHDQDLAAHLAQFVQRE